jgi:thioredoxin 1
MAKPIVISDITFKSKVLESDLPVVLEFYAPWCHACQGMKPIIEEAAESLAGKAVVGMLNVERNPKTPMHLQIQAIPALFLFRAGKTPEAAFGALSRGSLGKLLAQWGLTPEKKASRK